MTSRNSSSVLLRRMSRWYKMAFFGAGFALTGTMATAQITVPGSHANMAAAFAAINAGTFTGAVTIDVTGSYAEPAGSAVLNSSGAGAASYTSVTIRPAVPGVVITGTTVSGRGIIELNGADNVTINGDAPGGGANDRDLTITNTAVNTTTLTSVIRVATSTLITTATGVVVQNCNINGSATGRNIAAATSTGGSEGNTFGIVCGGGASTVAATTAPSALAISSTMGATISANGFTVTNNAIDACARGIAFMGTSIANATTLTISNNIVGNATPGNTTTVYLQGISLAGFTAATVSGNTVRNIESFCSNSSTNNLQCVGISVGAWAATGTNGVVENNTVQRVFNRNTGSFAATGIHVNLQTASNTTLRNNFVSDITSDQTGGAQFSVGFSNHGIKLTAGTTYNVYHNTVNMFGALPGTATASHLTSCLAIGATTVQNVNVRNNIFSNTVTGGTTSIAHVVLHLPTSGTSAMNLTLNNNAYYAGSTAGVHGVAHVGTTYSATGAGAATFAGLYTAPNFNAGTTTPASGATANFRAYSSILAAGGANDNASLAFTTAAPFTSSTNLHINTGLTPTQLESGGAAIGITTDIDGQVRPGPAGSVNGGAFAPDMGADEFDGVPLDLAAPLITYTPLTNTLSTANRTQSITVTDPSGVPVAGIGLPVIYYRKNAGAYVSNQCTSTGGSGYDCVIDNTLIGGVVATDVIDFYVAAQDNAPTPNVGANPSAGAAGFTANPPAAATAPTTPNSYAISSPISGTINVGVGETYTSLTRNDAAGLFRFINNNVVAGNITINITSNLTLEDGAVALNAFASPFTVSMNPTGAPRSITGAVAANALIRTNGASRFIIDGSTSGGTDRSLTIQNTSVTTPQVVRFSSIGVTPITDITLKNCIIRNGVNTSSAIVLTDNAGGAEYFNNITIQNNDIGLAFIGVFANAALSAGNGSGLLITQNTVNNTGANAIRLVGLYAQGVDGGTISANTVGNFESATAEGKTGIWLATGTVNTAITGNTVSTIGHTAPQTASGVYGIRDTGGAAASGNSITGNSVSAIVAQAGLSAGVVGIGCSSGGTLIQRNTVTGINNTHTGTWPAMGIDVIGGNNMVVKNNFISDVTGVMTGGAAFNPTFGISGIRIGAGTGHLILNNSVNLFGLRAGTATTSLLTAALSVVATSSTGLDIRNNILANNMTGGTTSIANVSIYLPSGGSAAMALLENNNSYYRGTDAARAGVGQAGTTAGVNFFTTLAALTAYSNTLGNATNDNASLSSTGAVPYATSSDLHINGTAAEFNTGATILSVTNDIDGDARPQGASYDIGGDEAVATPCAGLPSAGTSSATTPTTVCAGLTVGFTNNAVNAVTGISYQWQVGPVGGPYADVVGGTGATTQNFTTAALTAGTYGFVLRVRCDNEIVPAGDSFSNEVSVTVNPAPTSVPTSNSPVCTTGTLNLFGGTDFGTGFAWTGPNGFASASQNPSIVGVTTAASGIYSLVVTGAGCPSAPATTTVVVDVTPTVPVMTPTAAVACPGDPVNLSASSTAFNVSSVSGAALTIPNTGATGLSTPYPATAVVAGLPVAGVTVTKVTITGLHTWNNDMDVLLQSPTAQNVIVMSDCGNDTNGEDFSGTYNFVDGGALMVNTGGNVAGTYACTNLGGGGGAIAGTDQWPAPGPGTSPVASTLLSSFTGNMNGTWNLYVVDDTSIDGGSITGWSIEFTSSANITYTWSPGTGLNQTSGPSVISTASTFQTYTVTATNAGCTAQNTVDVGRLCNDLCADAIAVACNSVTPGTTIGALSDAVPTCTTPLNTAGGVWYTVVGTGGSITASVCGAAYDSKIGVFTTPDCAAFTCIAGDNNACGDDGEVTFASILGQTYHILVTGFGTATGNFTLEVVCTGDGACNDNGVQVAIHTDNNGSETSWEIVPVGNTVPVCSGSGYSSNANITIDCCLIDGCYTLAFFDSFGDGMCCLNGTGGYKLSTANGKRIIDNTDDGEFLSVSSVANGFCLPIGGTQLTIATCDKEDFLINDVVVSGIDPLVSAEFGVTDATSGYQFWLFDPDGSYSRRLFRSHANGSCVGTPSGPTRAAHMKFSCMNSSLPNVPLDLMLNMRVRPRIAGQYGEFGPACRVMVLSAPLACPTTQLDNNPLHAGTTLSCNVTGKTVAASGYAGKLYPNIVAGANKYQYEFVQAGEGYTRLIATATGSYALTLTNWVLNPLLCGTYTYEVRVRVSFDGGANWCPFGPVCEVEITNNPPNNCTTTFQGGGGNLNSIAADNEGINMWPNPTRNGNVTLELNGLDSEAMVATVDMFDLFGKKVMSNTLNTDGAQELTTVFNTNDLAAGMYTVNVISGNTTFTSRLVIE